MLIGHETEYGIVDRGCDPGTAANRLLHLASQASCLPAYGGGGIFLSNGGRFYVDCAHPEIATPEVVNPFEAVVCLLAGDEFVRQLAAQVSGPQNRFSVYKANVDYRSLTTWASHENYSHRFNPEELPKYLIPHLTSRIILTGAGGLAPHLPGIRFVISPRACFLERDISTNSTSSRGILHLKNEPLATGWHRLHLLCGESLLSHRSSLLRIGTTALLVALLDAGFKPGFKSVFPGPALDALRKFNLDPVLHATAELKNSTPTTALQLQWEYLKFAEDHLSERLPDWAGEVTKLWRETLGLLERGVDEASTHLDWAIKYQQYTNYTRIRGFSPHEIERWNLFLENERAPMETRPPRGAERALLPDVLFWPQFHEVRPRAIANKAALKQSGLEPDRLEEFFRLRDELCELEIRFSELGPEGLFKQLDARGLLQHRLAQVTEAGVHQAVRCPPAKGRARLRGQMVRQLSDQRDRFACDWQAIFDLGQNRRLDLSEPLVEQAEWKPWKYRDREACHADQTSLRLQRVHHEAERCFNQGNYNQAAVLLSENDQQLNRMPAYFQHQWMELHAFSEARRGQIVRARRACTRLASLLGRDSLKLCATVVSTLRFCGLVPAPQIQIWLRKGEQMLENSPPTDVDEYDLFTLRYHQGRTLTVHGQLERAKELLERLVLNGSFSGCHPRTFSRAQCDFADALRRLSLIDAAREQLRRARELHATRGFEGDLADHSLTGLAKLGDDEEAGAALRAALAIQERLNLQMGLVRSLCLEARRFPHQARRNETITRVLALAAETPALRCCRVFRRISRHWSEWLDGAPHPEIDDFYWGL